MKKDQGLFIVVEGIEGAGKSTVMEYIRAYLTERKLPFVMTREPGGTQIAEAIRLVLLDYYEEPMAEDTELMLMFASRAQHIAQLIKPAIAEGKIVVSDRFSDASFAYQGAGRGIDQMRIAELAHWVKGDLRPDATILLDLPAEIGLERIQARASAPDRIEQEELSFFERVRESYLARAKEYASEYHIVDATQTIDAVQTAVKEILDHVIQVAE